MANGSTMGSSGDTIVDLDLGAGTFAYMTGTGKLPASAIYWSVDTSTAPTPVTNAHPFPVGVQGTVVLGAGSAAVGSITNTGFVSTGNVASGVADSGNPVKVGGVYNTSAPTLTNAQRGDMQLDASGNLKVNIAAGASSGAVAQGSTTSGQTGSLIQGAVTTSAPTYTTGQTSPLSLDTAGNLRVNVTAGGSSGVVTQGSTTSGQSGMLIQGAVSASQASYTSGQTSPLSLDTNGLLRVNVSAGAPSQYSEGATASTATGTVMLGKNSTSVKSLQTDASGNLRVDISQTSVNGTAIKVDGSGVTQPVSLATLPALVAGSAKVGIFTTDQTTHGTTDLMASDLTKILGAAISASNGMPIYDGFQAPSATTWNSGTAANTALTATTSGYDTVVVSLTFSGSVTAGAITFEVYDGAAWLQIKAARILTYNTEGSYTLVSANGAVGWQVPVAGFPQFRVRLSTQITGAGSATVTNIVSSAPDTSVVTVGLDPNAPLPAGTNTIGAVNLAASTTGGYTPFTFISAGNTTPSTVKSSAGTLHSLYIFNTTATIYYVKFFNKLSPTMGTDSPVLNLPVPASTNGAGFTLILDAAFGTAISVAVTTGQALTDNTAGTAGAVVINGFWI